MTRALALAILVLGIAPCASAAAGWRLVASKHTYAIYAKLDVSANVNHPSAIALRVIGQPAQATDIRWSLVCSKGARTGSTSGSYVSQTTALQPLRLPLALPRSCKATVHSVFPNGGGTLTLKIYSRS